MRDRRPHRKACMLHARDLYDNCEWPAAAIVNDNACMVRHSQVEHREQLPAEPATMGNKPRGYLSPGTRWYQGRYIPVTLPQLKLAA